MSIQLPWGLQSGDNYEYIAWLLHSRGFNTDYVKRRLDKNQVRSSSTPGRNLLMSYVELSYCRLVIAIREAADELMQRIRLSEAFWIIYIRCRLVVAYSRSPKTQKLAWDWSMWTGLTVQWIGCRLQFAEQCKRTPLVAHFRDAVVGRLLHYDQRACRCPLCLVEFVVYLGVMYDLMPEEQLQHIYYQRQINHRSIRSFDNNNWAKSNIAGLWSCDDNSESLSATSGGGKLNE